MIETQIIKLIPLTSDEILLYIQDNNDITQKLKLDHGKRDISESIKKAVHSYMIKEINKDKGNYLFNTIWIIVDKFKNRIIGHLAFKGKPDTDGTVELGYRTYEEFRNKGYMKESVKEIISWCKLQNKVKVITAVTSKNNPASARVLHGTDFEFIKEENEKVYWKKSLT